MLRMYRIPRRLVLCVAPFAIALGCAACGGDHSPTDPIAARLPEIQRLTDSGHLQANPIMSPDGNWILFESDSAGSMDLYRVAATGGTPERLTDDPAFDSSGTWASDGAEIVFESDRDGGVKHIFILTLDNPLAVPFALTSGPDEDGSPMVSRDGSRIVFESNRGKTEGSDLWILPSGGGDLIRVTETADGVYNRTADWSPDGTRVVYESNRSGSSAIYTQTVGEQDAKRITPDAAYEGHPAWSPDGKIIVFESTATGTSQLYAVAAAGGEALRLTSQGGFWPRFSPDGALVLYGVIEDSAYGIWLMEADF